MTERAKSMAEEAKSTISEEDYERLLSKPEKREQESDISQEEDVPNIGEFINKRRLAKENRITEEIIEARKKAPMNIGENRKRIDKQLRPKGIRKDKKDKGRRSEEY